MAHEAFRAQRRVTPYPSRRRALLALLRLLERLDELARIMPPLIFLHVVQRLVDAGRLQCLFESRPHLLVAKQRIYQMVWHIRLLCLLLLLLDHLTQDVALGLLGHIVELGVDRVCLQNLGQLVTYALITQHLVEFSVAWQVATIL